MTREKKMLRVEIIGYEDQVQVLAKFLATMAYCGAVGASRILALSVDGDGAARLKVNFPDMTETFDIKDKDTDPDTIKFFID